MHGLTPADLRDPARGRLASAARKLFCWVAIREFGHRGSDVGPDIARHPSIATRYSKASVDPQRVAKVLALLPGRLD